MTREIIVKTPLGDIRCTLTQKRVKNINLRVTADGEVRISASPRVPLRTIEQFVSSKADFILSAQRKINALRKPPQEYTDGAELYILGRPAAIVTVSSGKSFYAADTLFLRTDNAPELCKPAYDKWEADFCKTLFREMTDKVHALYARNDIPNPSITVRDMSSRWGSCRPDKAKITLNKKLVHAPADCIYYVIAHELAHFVQPNHSARFYAVVEEIMPDWKMRKKLLEAFAAENIR